MSTSLARRIRRIGLLPTLSLQEVLDENQQTKLKNAHNRADTAKDKVIAAEQQVAFVKKNPKASEVEKTAAKNALAEAESEKYAADKNLKDLTADLERQLNSARRRRLPLTTEQVKAEADKLTAEAKANRDKQQAEQKKARAAHVKRVFALKTKKAA